jgi:hypothetical protein
MLQFSNDCLLNLSSPYSSFEQNRNETSPEHFLRNCKLRLQSLRGVADVRNQRPSVLFLRPAGTDLDQMKLPFKKAITDAQPTD